MSFFEKLAADKWMTLGTNLTAPTDWSTELAFRNPLVTSRPWISGTVGGIWNDGRKVSVSPDGWPTMLLPGQVARTLLHAFDDALPRPTGTYKISYAGSGRLNYAQAGQVVSRSPGLDIVRVAPGAPLEIDVVHVNVQNPLRDIRIVCSDDHEHSHPLFRQPFLDSLRGYKIVRFCDWQGTNGSQQKNWSERARMSQARWTTVGSGDGTGWASGVPLEAMIELCNTLGVAPWFCIPHGASNAYVTDMAELIHQDLATQLPVVIEFSNEIWNRTLPQFGYAAAQAQILRERAGLSASSPGTPLQWQLRWYAQRAVECFQIFERFFPPSRLARVLGSQYADPAATEWMLDGEATQSHVDAVALAPWLYNETATPESLDDLFLRMECARARITETHIPAQQRAAGGLPIVCYCGGDGIMMADESGANAEILIAAAADPRMQTLYTEYLQGLSDAGVVAFLHQANTASGRCNPGFGAQDYLGQMPLPPKLAALRNWMGILTGATAPPVSGTRERADTSPAIPANPPDVAETMKALGLSSKGRKKRR